MLVAVVGLLVFTLPPNRVKLFDYFQIAMSYIGAMFASNVALAYVSYPTQALGKSCKLIPVMLTRIFVNRVSYETREYVNVALTTAGITMFQLYQVCGL
jgi:UDP-galactose transporter B1